MRKLITFAGSFLMMVFLFSSCSGLRQYSKVNSLDFTPNEVRLHMDMSNYDLLGESTITVDFRTYLGFIKTIDKVNDKDYNFREVKTVNLIGSRISKDLSKALYKVVEQYPEADYYVPVYEKNETYHMFLGKATKKTMVVKAYKLK